MAVLNAGTHPSIGDYREKSGVCSDATMRKLDHDSILFLFLCVVCAERHQVPSRTVCWPGEGSYIVGVEARLCEVHEEYAYGEAMGSCGEEEVQCLGEGAHAKGDCLNRSGRSSAEGKGDSEFGCSIESHSQLIRMSTKLSVIPCPVHSTVGDRRNNIPAQHKCLLVRWIGWMPLSAEEQSSTHPQAVLIDSAVGGLCVASNA